MKTKPAKALLPKLILVPCDFSECSTVALAQAAALANMTGGKLTLLYVIEPVQPGFLMDGAVSRQAQGRMRERAGRELTALAKIHGAGAQFSRPLVKAGKPWEIIVSVASKTNADMIVLGTHGYTGLRHAMLGSVAERVVRRAPCPVLTVPMKGE